MTEIDRELHEARRIVAAFWQWANLCHCGNTDEVLPFLRAALEAHGEPGPEFDGGPDLAEWWGDPKSMFVLYVLDGWGLTEHGVSVVGAWLSSDGIRLRDALRKVDPETVFDDDWFQNEEALNPDVSVIEVGPWKPAAAS